MVLKASVPAMKGSTSMNTLSVFSPCWVSKGANMSAIRSELPDSHTMRFTVLNSNGAMRVSPCRVVIAVV